MHKHVVSDLINRLNTSASLALNTLAAMFLSMFLYIFPENPQENNLTLSRNILVDERLLYDRGVCFDAYKNLQKNLNAVNGFKKILRIV